ncbi:unnamed protein product [Ixodes persulcatus]
MLVTFTTRCHILRHSSYLGLVQTIELYSPKGTRQIGKFHSSLAHRRLPKIQVPHIPMHYHFSQ